MTAATTPKKPAIVMRREAKVEGIIVTREPGSAIGYVIRRAQGRSEHAALFNR